MPRLRVQVCEECSDEDDTNVRWCQIKDVDTGYMESLWLCRFCFGEIDGTAKLDPRDWYDKGDEYQGWAESPTHWRVTQEQKAILWDLGALKEGHPFAAGSRGEPPTRRETA